MSIVLSVRGAVPPKPGRIAGTFKNDRLSRYRFKGLADELCVTMAAGPKLGESDCLVKVDQRHEDAESVW